MTGAIPLKWPVGAALAGKAVHRFMDIILHVGAHRTGTTSFQDYLRRRRGMFKADGTVIWDPKSTRKQLFAGMFPGPAVAKGRDLRQRAEGRVKLRTERTRQGGAARLLVSEENMIGSSRHCLRNRSLYPAIGERMARLNAAFGDKVSRVVLTIRSPDLWWSSAMAFSVGRGHMVPDHAARDQIVCNSRTWRDVITDLSCAVPQAEIMVVPFEQSVGRPDWLATIATGRPAPSDGAGTWLNRAPNLADLRALVAERGDDPAKLAQKIPADLGRWHPFDRAQIAALRETYADDLFWLMAGADGLATLTEDSTRTRADQTLPSRVMTKGHDDDIGQRKLAQSG